jgi:Crp-like helix-turn-helix domain
MLAVRRTTVSAVATQLQKTGAISYARGKMHVLDHRALQRLSCECNRVLKQ